MIQRQERQKLVALKKGMAADERGYRDDEQTRLLQEIVHIIEEQNELFAGMLGEVEDRLTQKIDECEDMICKRLMYGLNITLKKYNQDGMM